MARYIWWWTFLRGLFQECKKITVDNFQYSIMLALQDCHHGIGCQVLHLLGEYTIALPVKYCTFWENISWHCLSSTAFIGKIYHGIGCQVVHLLEDISWHWLSSTAFTGRIYHSIGCQVMHLMGGYIMALTVKYSIY